MRTLELKKVTPLTDKTYWGVFLDGYMVDCFFEDGEQRALKLYDEIKAGKTQVTEVLRSEEI